MAHASTASATPSARRMNNSNSSNSHSSSTRIDFSALRQWSDGGRVKRPAAGSNLRRYRLGRWHSRSTGCSWNPPSNTHVPLAPGEDNTLDNPALSIDISHKPSESRRSSIISGAPSICISDDAASDNGDGDDVENGPLAQMLLRENDEIWNNNMFRFTFYSPLTGTVRSADVRSLRTDRAEGLEQLMRQATGKPMGDDDGDDGDAREVEKDRRRARESDEEADEGVAEVPGFPGGSAGSRPPQLSVTSVDSVPDTEAAGQAAAAAAPDNSLLHPNYARTPSPGAPPADPSARRRRAPRRPAQSPSSAPPDAETPGHATKRTTPSLFWLDIMDPSESEIRALSSIFGLHPLTTEELLLMRDQGLVQDNYKSFHHYDFVCYRTSAAYSPGVQEMGGSVARSMGTGGLRSRRSFVHSERESVYVPGDRMGEAAAASWEAGEETKEGQKPSALAAADAADEKGAGGEDSLRARLRRLFVRPQRQPPPEHVPVPSIALPSSRAPSYHAADASEDNLDEPAPFYIIILDSGVLTLHYGNLPHVRNTIGRLLLDEELVGLTPDYVAYLLLDDITDTLVPTTRLLELEVDAIDELVLILTRAEHDDVLKRIGIERRHALWLVRLLHGKAEVLRAIERRILTKMGISKPPGCTSAGQLARRAGSSGRRGTRSASSCASSSSSSSSLDSEPASDREMLNSQLLTSDEEEGDLYGWSRRAPKPPATPPRSSSAAATMQAEVTKYLADVHDHLIALTASVHHCERILARAHGNYLARINLELTHASNTTNQLATQMTVLAGIFLPLNLVAGIFGMNVKVPGRDRDDLRDFGLILGAMAAFVVISLVVCRWRRII
ncbi:CorA metal ion transporter [Coemansia erecta]|uniref:CorA metal ion transporter n=1 Tax=Coemansia erecta TaxID=147472 RepID=A0A9W7Y2A8_9FUNG|nr:CorA metal ion transporter [Coemansia erecta]